MRVIITVESTGLQKINTQLTKHETRDIFGDQKGPGRSSRLSIIFKTFKIVFIKIIFKVLDF
jgi:hypothetical protein